MPLSEFEIITKYFSRPASGANIVVGVGDDAAVVQFANDRHLVVATDTLVSGIHFPVDSPPHAVGYRALAVNLSDLAAMGAKPQWFFLNLSLPEADEQWLEGFAKGLFSLADRYAIQLLGGDTVQGPLNIGITVLGKVEPDAAMTRTGAKTGELICVSGTIGDAYLGLLALQGKLATQDASLINRFQYPEPRVGLGGILCGNASAAIDVSDGLHVDLARLLAASGLGGTVQLANVPLSGQAREALTNEVKLRDLLSGGDDYELCFTLPEQEFKDVQGSAAAFGVAVTNIGKVEQQPGLRWLDADDAIVDVPSEGYRHFDSG